ncbi:hypothetical protein LZM27_19075 [Pseudomonas aeruginosa]|uniref:hypothetical protein n=1 Tax=Pseudomonas aeruginosa TaxID=287 RepID=UPI00085947C8|nr:hypothetical protein [Pseudomonas aeruginosa]MCT4805196.1 hypothetical protein [Pseudomonas aeruginosa]MCT4815327.1 hypothetical protein [Pseudomonas aeruginosa]MCT4818917.1 hypothetical protein [Pseudomonas aeruginosa]MCT4828646.1 hypothetical protein [Pseudomonas aeruginosa]MCT4850968.1 hypothetical protein [Pseudomonas aeruginosa]
MAEIIDLDTRRSHVTITTHSNKAHVVPLSVFESIARGNMTVDTLDHRDELMRVIVAEWMGSLGVHGADALRVIED